MKTIGLEPELSGFRAEEVTEVKGRICAVVAGGRHVGTGFLAGPRVVMTCLHAYTMAAEIGSGEFFAVFDCDGSRPFHQLPRYRLLQQPLAASTELDYAILEVFGRPGDTRGYFELVSYRNIREEPIHVIGHPASKGPEPPPISHTIGFLSDSNDLTRRIAYTSETAFGSSGSPVFNRSLRLMALHHHGQAEVANHGIPMWAIIEDLVQARKLHRPPSPPLVIVSEQGNRKIRIPQACADQATAVPAHLRTGALLPARPVAGVSEEDLAGAVGKYLTELVAWAEKLPLYFPFGTRLGNVRVRVRARHERRPQDPIRERMEETARREGDYAEDRAYHHRHYAEEHEGSEERDHSQLLDWDDQLRGTLRRGVILADPGLGKSWLLKWETRRLALEAQAKLQETANAAELILPMFVRLEDLGAALTGLLENHQGGAETKRSTFHEALLGALLDVTRSETLDHALRVALNEGRCVLLLDAWDEATAHHGALRSTLRDYVEGPQPGRLWLTSRIVGQPGELWSRQPEQDRVLELQPFYIAQQDEFIDQFFTDESVRSAVKQQLRATPQLNGLAQVPLLLGFLCAYVHQNFVLSQRAPAGISLQGLGRNDLYAFIVDSHLRKTWHEGEATARLEPSGTQLAEDQVEEDRRMLSHIAYQLLAKNRQQFAYDDLITAIRAACRAAYETPWTADEQKAWYRRMVGASGIIIRSGRRTDVPHLFLHLTTQEYLAAQYMHRLSPKKLTKLVGRLWDHPTWQEVWSLFVAELPARRDRDGSKILDALMAEVLSHGHPLDTHLQRPQVCAVRWIILAGIEPNQRTPHCAAVVHWALQLKDKAVRDAMLRALERTYGRMPHALREHLCNMLSDGDLDVQKAAVGALAPHAGDDRVQSQLVERLNAKEHTSEGLRMKVISALSPYAGSEPLQSQLLKRLNDADSSVRSAAVDALAQHTGNDQIRAELLKRLDEDSDVGLAVVKALAQYASSEEVRDKFVDLFNSLHNEFDSLYAKQWFIRHEVSKVLLEHVRHKRVLIALVKALDRFGPDVRYELSHALYKHASDEVVWTELLGWLDNESTRISHAVTDAIGAHAGNKKLRGKLLERLTDSGSSAARVIEALSRASGNEQVRAELVKRLESKDSQIRIAVVDALARQTRDNEVRTKLIKLLDDDVADVRSAAIRALARAPGDELLRNALIQRLDDASSLVRSSVICELVPHALTDSNALAYFARDEHVQAKLFKRLDDEDSWVRRHTIRALALQAYDDKVRSQLLIRLDDEDPFMRRAVIDALSPHVGDARVRNALLLRLTNECTDSRIAVIRALTPHADDKRVCTEVLRQRDTNDRFIRDAVIEFLARNVDDEQVRTVLLDIDDLGDGSGRHSALAALAQHGSDERVQTWLLKQLGDADSDFRHYVVDALVPLADYRRVRSVLFELLVDKNCWIRRKATDALVRHFGNQQVRGELVSLLDNDGADIRFDALNALAQHADDEQVMARLLERLEDEESSVREKAYDICASVIVRQRHDIR